MIILQASGQTCNQFWIYSNFIADVIEKNEKFAIWVPDISFEYFPNLLNSKFICYPLYSKKLSLLLGYHRYIKILNFIFLNKIILRVCEFIINNLTKHTFLIADVFVEKSSFRYKNLKKLLGFYATTKLISDRVDLFIENIRKEHEIVVGVHIRYGDYRTFENGKYFYSLVAYTNFIKHIQEIFVNKKIAFFITCNENIDRSYFKDYNCYYTTSNLMAEDLYCLSQVDYILGPPSTFSAWASLYKNTPLYFIESPTKDFSANDFIDIKSIWF